MTIRKCPCCKNPLDDQPVDDNYSLCLGCGFYVVKKGAKLHVANVLDIPKDIKKELNKIRQEWLIMKREGKLV